MEQSASWEVSSHSPGQVSYLLWNAKFRYRVRKIPSQVPILSQMNPVHTFPPYFPNIHSNISSRLRLGLPRGLFPSGFLTKILYAFIISIMCATCSTHPILLDLLIVIIFGEVYNLWSSS
jgi:hypothetical protein